MKPVRYKNLRNRTVGICVSGNWLVASFWSQNTVRLYSLPGLVPGQEVSMRRPRAPRSTSDGLIYVPNWNMVKELMISQEGALSVRRNITVDSVHITFVALGPQTGQLCILGWSPNGTMTIYIVHLGDDVTVQQTLTMSSEIGPYSVISTLHTGLILVTTRNMDMGQILSALINTTEASGMVAHKPHAG